MRCARPSLPSPARFAWSSTKAASALAAATLPRQINAQSELQAASPAYETARLFRIVGVGV